MGLRLMGDMLSFVCRILTRNIDPGRMPCGHICMPCSPGFTMRSHICILPSNALCSVNSSMYSKSPPTGIPLAILLTFTPSGFTSLLM